MKKKLEATGIFLQKDIENYKDESLKQRWNNKKNFSKKKTDIQIQKQMKIFENLIRSLVSRLRYIFCEFHQLT